nr:7TM GPCR chemoreceptor domain containing protein [Haemonchus contortus]
MESSRLHSESVQTGAVFCSSITLNWYAGYFSWCVWFGALFNCMVLALNRIVEMTPSARSLGFLFRENMRIGDEKFILGKFLLSWMVLSILLMTILPFISRTHPYSSQISTYIISPEITDNPTQLFTQALFICTTTAITALLYSWIEFFPAPRAMAVASHILWQLSHGLHGIVYLCLNRQIRGEVSFSQELLEELFPSWQELTACSSCFGGLQTFWEYVKTGRTAVSST